MPFQGQPFHHGKFVDCLRKLFHGPVPCSLTKWPSRDNSVGTIYFENGLTEEVIAVCAAYVRIIRSQE